MILPTTLASTFADQRFATYVGIGAADVRIDIRDNTINPEKVTKDAESDPDVTNVVRLTSNRYDIKKADGWETIVVERGDHTVFPLSYTSGHAPTDLDEIALSYNQAQEINADLGHTITMRTPGGEKQLRVSGIYQDVTNGESRLRGLRTRSLGGCVPAACVWCRRACKNRAAHEHLPRGQSEQC